jgi:sulfoxide reductase heme-binding subunit YedZ
VSSALWYLGRGTGLVSLVLLTIVVVLGIGNRSGRPAFGLPRFAVTVVHRNAALLAVTLLAIHVGTLLFDPYAQLRLIDVVLPFRGSYRPLWQGLGTLAVDIIIALTITSLVRHRLGLRAWRVVHWLAYAAWPLALVHGLRNGTDARTAWLLATAILCTSSVLGAVLWRLSSGFGEHDETRAVTDTLRERSTGPRDSHPTQHLTTRQLSSRPASGPVRMETHR